VTCEDDDEVADMLKLTGKYVRLFVWTPLKSILVSSLCF
jgi:hypothetical protein